MKLLIEPWDYLLWHLVRERRPMTAVELDEGWYYGDLREIQGQLQRLCKRGVVRSAGDAFEAVVGEWVDATSSSGMGSVFILGDRRYLSAHLPSVRKPSRPELRSWEDNRFRVHHLMRQVWSAAEVKAEAELWASQLILAELHETRRQWLLLRREEAI
jgi:hypothetical protein